ncbi:MAG TPA: YciI family protein [Solirubrobacteraceae bacterium]
MRAPWHGRIKSELTRARDQLCDLHPQPRRGATSPSHAPGIHGRVDRAETLIAASPFIDGTGALFIYEAPSLEAAQAIVAADPYTTGGAFARTELKVWEVVKAQPTLLAPSVPA